MGETTYGTATRDFVQVVNKNNLCPNCGYCACCGRGGYFVQPYPWRPQYPHWGQWQGTLLGQQGNQTDLTQGPVTACNHEPSGQ